MPATHVYSLNGCGGSNHLEAEESGDGESTPSQRIRIVIADDHTVVRTGFRLLLDRECDFEVVAEVGDVESARSAVRGHHPHILVLDLNMPGHSSLGAIPIIREESPDTQIVVLTMRQKPASAREALVAGALGYVLKNAARGEFAEAVRWAAAGTPYVSRSMAALLESEPPESPDDLSNRELGVLRLIALGHTNAEIAEQLYRPARTVETDRLNIQQKLTLFSCTELVEYALEHRLIGDGADIEC